MILAITFLLLQGISIDLQWDSVPTDTDGNPIAIEGFNVHKGERDGPYTKINNGIVLTTSYNDSTGINGDCYVVSAVATTGLESAFSNETCLVPPNPPRNLFFRVVMAILNFFRGIFV